MTEAITLQDVAVHPTADRIVVRVIEEPDTTATGIFLVREEGREKSQHGIVTAVGPGVRDINGDHIEPSVEEGDEILFARYSGVEVKLEDENLLVLREGDILAKLTRED